MMNTKIKVSKNEFTTQRRRVSPTILTTVASLVDNDSPSLEAGTALVDNEASLVEAAAVLVDEDSASVREVAEVGGTPEKEEESAFILTC